MRTQQTPLAILTGASSGIGEHTARLLAERGYRTLLIARRGGRIAALAEELTTRTGYAATPMVLDMANAERIEPAISAALDEHGPAAVLVNNAGYGLYQPFVEHTWEDHRRLMQVNYFAAVAMIRAVLPGMQRQDAGHVINVASISAKIAPWGHSGYTASKAAMTALTQTLAAEYLDTAIHFSVINPGIVRTDYFDAPTFQAIKQRVWRHGIAPQRVARAIVSLIDRPRLQLCVPRLYRLLDWFNAVAPSRAHRLVAAHSRPLAGARGNGRD